jgi:hypothetical protein
MPAFQFAEANLPAATFAVFSMIFFAQANPRPLFGPACAQKVASVQFLLFGKGRCQESVTR